MNKKDQLVFKKTIGNCETSPIEKIESVYVDVLRIEMRSQAPQKFQLVDELEAAQYSDMFKKAMSGKLGVNAIELTPETNKLKILLDEPNNEDSEFKKMCTQLKEVFQSEENYSIFAAVGNFFIPSSYTKKELSGESVRFILLVFSPCALSKPGMIYDYSGNVFKDREKDHSIKPPECAFLYPSLDDLHPDYNHVMYFAKNAASVKKYENIVEELLGTGIPSTPEEQAEGFQQILSSAFKGLVPYDTLQGVYSYFDELKEDAAASGEEASLSASELADAVIKYGNIPEDETPKVREAADDFGSVKFSVPNLAPDKISIETDCAVVKLNLHDFDEIRKEVVNGQEYYLIPTKNTSIQSMRVH